MTGVTYRVQMHARRGRHNGRPQGSHTDFQARRQANDLVIYSRGGRNGHMTVSKV